MKRKKILFLFLYIISNLSFSQEPVLRANNVHFEYSIYFLNNTSLELSKVKEKIKSSYPSLFLTDSIDEGNFTKTQVILSEIKPITEAYQPQSIEYLNYFGRGLDENQMLALQNSSYLLNILFYNGKENAIQTVNEATKLILDITKNHEAIIYDSETRESFTRAYWEGRRNNNADQISKHITLHFYQNENEFCRAITLGLNKYGIPDICINNLLCSNGNEASLLINITAQLLVERKATVKEENVSLHINAIKNKEAKEYYLDQLKKNAKKKTTITLKNALWEEGDPNNSILEIAFPEINPQIQQNEVFKELFGKNEEIIALRHDEELIKTSEKAKEKIPDLFALFSAGLPMDTSLQMKFNFEDETGENEWMWVEVVKWEDDTITGILNNEPYYIKNVKLGQEVKKNVYDMFDYILFLPDGSYEGNETGKIIEKMNAK